MKKNTHPDYQEVLFEDTSNGKRFVIRSTLKPQEKATHEGKEYPLYRLSISSYSHPLFIGKNQVVDTEGRIDKFNKRFKRGAK
ncbi:MAG: type B 50S ribosomal protein L31 [Chlamydiia bacterium]|nr:type B 50S ribosomal protein L31 [Chlamydiia bacterium]